MRNITPAHRLNNIAREIRALESELPDTDEAQDALHDLADAHARLGHVVRPIADPHPDETDDSISGMDVLGGADA